MGGSGAGSGGSATLDAAFGFDEPATASDAPRSALVPEDARAAIALEMAAAVPADLTADAPSVAAVAAVVAAGALAPPGSVAAAGMLAPAGAAEKVLDGNGGRDGTPVDEVLGGGALRGGICDSRVISTLVLFASA